MSKIRVLIEVEQRQPEAFSKHAAALGSTVEASRQNESVADKLAGLGVEIIEDSPPVPLFDEQVVRGTERTAGFAAFAAPFTNPDMEAATVVLRGEIEPGRLESLKAKKGVKVYADSRLTLYPSKAPVPAPAAAQAEVDCPPFRPPVGARAVRNQLGVAPFFQAGYRGQGIVVGILDEGINGNVYPVRGGFFRKNALPPGQASIASHGSMCAADVMIAAPGSTLYDYPFLGIPDSGGALGMFHALLEQRRKDGTPHVVSNSYGFVGVPPREQNANHEIHDLNHPLHRKIREVVASGVVVFFAAGNCGTPSPSGKCLPSGVGPGKSIHGSNSLEEVITVAAVNVHGQRVCYSSIGPGMFAPQKPDLATCTHFFGNFGPNRPGGQSESAYDNGTSAACPVAAGVAALLLSVFGPLEPAVLKAGLTEGALHPDGSSGWNPETGFGILNAWTAYEKLAATFT